MAKSRQPRKNGRPTVYRKEFEDRVYRYALLGLTDAQIAECFMVAESTIHNWKLRHNGFSESIMRGKREADGVVAESLYHRAKGYSHDAVRIFMPSGASEPIYAPYIEHYPPDTQAASLWLRNRQSALWRDKRDHEVTGKDGGPLEIRSDMTPEEVTARYLEIMRGES